MSAAERVAQAAETIRARWEQRTVESPQVEAAQALEDAGLLAVAAHEVGAQAPSADPRIELIRKERTHCEVTRFESEDDRLPHVWGPSSYPKREMCQRCTVSREWAEDPEAADVVLLAEVDRLSAQVAELLAERHSTNEALSDAAERLRADRDRIAELEKREAIVTEFVAKRAEYITAIHNCHPDNAHDYDRWQGHAAARRQLAELLGLPVAWPAEVPATGAEASR